MVDIPNLYPEQELIINGNPVLIGSYSGYDTTYTVPLQQCKTQLPELIRKVSIFKNIQNKINAQKKDNAELQDEDVMTYLQEMDDDDFSDEEIHELMEATDKVHELNAQIEEYSELLAQRGLKRFYYKDEPEYIQADIDNNLKNYLDSLPTIKASMDDFKRIANTMIELGGPSEKLLRAGADKGKPKKKRGPQSKKK